MAKQHEIHTRRYSSYHSESPTGLHVFLAIIFELGFRASRELGLRLTEAGQQIVTENT